MDLVAIQQSTEPEGDDDDYDIQIFHDTQPELSLITATTQLLTAKAEELGGAYDGWETSVESGRDRDGASGSTEN